jgi:hypothetical protein
VFSTGKTIQNGEDKLNDSMQSLMAESLQSTRICSGFGYKAMPVSEEKRQ